MANTSKSTKKTVRRTGTTTSSGSRNAGARRTASRTATSKNAGLEENDELTTSGRSSSERNTGDRERSYDDDYRNSRYRGMSNDGEEGDLSRKSADENPNRYRTSQEDRPYGDEWGYREERTPYGENWGREDRSMGNRSRNNEGRSSGFNQGWTQRDDDRNRRSYDDEIDSGRNRSRREERDYDDNRGYGPSSQRDRSYGTNQDRFMDHDRSWGKGGHEDEWQDNRNRRESYDDQYGRQGTGYNEGYERRGYSRNDEWDGRQNRRSGGMSLYNQDDSDMRRGRNDSDWNMGSSRYEAQDRGYDRNRDSYSGRQSFNQGDSRYMDDRRSEGFGDRREGRNWDDHHQERRNRRDRF